MCSIDVKSTAVAFKALPFFDQVEYDGLMTQLKEKASDGQVTHAVLHEAFKGLGIDKEIEEEPPAEAEEGEGGDEDGEAGKEAEGEGEGEAEAAPPKPVKFTDNAAEFFKVVDPSGSGSVSATDLLATLQLCTGGWGEATLKNIMTAFDTANRGALDEHSLFSAITWACPKATSFQQRSHLRKAWRQAERWAPEEKEEEEEAGDEEEGDEGKQEEAESKQEEGEPEPEPVRVLIDDWLDKAREDEYLASFLLTDIPVPVDEVEGEDED